MRNVRVAKVGDRARRAAVVEDQEVIGEKERAALVRDDGAEVADVARGEWQVGHDRMEGDGAGRPVTMKPASPTPPVATRPCASQATAYAAESRGSVVVRQRAPS